MIRTSLSRALALACLAFLLAHGRVLAHTPAAEMANAAHALLASLDDAQRQTVSFPWQDDERMNWHFIPRERRGLPWKDMKPAQRLLASALLGSALSQRGFVKATTIMSLEQILLELEQGRGPKRDPENYFWSIFGTPAADGTWGWRVEGHHLSLNFTLVAGQIVASTPSFLGTNPAEVRDGPRAGLRVLAAEEDLGRELLQSLSPEQRSLAIVSDKAPADILTAAERKASPLQPSGLLAAKMSPPQREILRRLIEEYVRRVRAEVADADLARIKDAGPEKIGFAWAGPNQPGQGHYYRVQGPTFLLEFDNTQNNANHVHAVWRDFQGDFGEDALARHYRETPH